MERREHWVEWLVRRMGLRREPVVVPVGQLIDDAAECGAPRHLMSLARLAPVLQDQGIVVGGGPANVHLEVVAIPPWVRAMLKCATETGIGRDAVDRALDEIGVAAEPGSRIAIMQDELIARRAIDRAAAREWVLPLVVDGVAAGMLDDDGAVLAEQAVSHGAPVGTTPTAALQALLDEITRLHQRLSRAGVAPDDGLAGQNLPEHEHGGHASTHLTRPFGESHNAPNKT